MKRIGLFLALLLFSQQAHADSVVVVLDASGSMEERMTTTDGQQVTRMEAAKTVLSATLLNLPKDTQVGIIVFPYQDWVYNLGPVEPTQLRAAINSINASGGTPLGRYMKTGVDALLESRKRNPYSTHRLLIVTDGEANDGYTVTENMDLILARGIVVNTIGVDMSSEHQLATKSHSYANAADPQALLKSVQGALSAEISADDPESTEMFEAISFLPDATVVSVLTSLTRVQNQPLGEEAPTIQVPVTNADGSPALDENGQQIMEEVPVGEVIADEGGGVGFIWILFGLVAAGALVFAVLKGSTR